MAMEEEKPSTPGEPATSKPADRTEADPPPPSLSPPPPSLSPPPSAPPVADPVAVPPTQPPPAAGAPVVLKPAAAEEDEEEGDGLPETNQRLLAGLIDMLVVVGIVFTVDLLLPEWRLLSKVPWLVGMAYLVFRDSLPFLGGQSIGKRATRLRVVKADGVSIAGDWTGALVRNALLLIPFFGPLVEAIVLMSREEKPERGLRLGDEWAKTRVVRDQAETDEEAGPPAGSDEPA